MTSIAIATTTIHEESLHCLNEWRVALQRSKCKNNLVIAGDATTPESVARWAVQIDSPASRVHYYSYKDQETDYPLLSHNIGPNTVLRRNFAIVKAKQLNPDFIMVIDDDNFPGDSYIIDQIVDTFGSQACDSAIVAQDYCNSFAMFKDYWMTNPGSMVDPPYISRGYPFFDGARTRLTRTNPYIRECKNQRRIDAAQLIITGDPDADAVTLLEHGRFKTELKKSTSPSDALYRAPLIVDGLMPMNTQAVVYRSSMAPMMLLAPNLGRYHDIFQGFVAQFWMKLQGSTAALSNVHVDHRRNPHDLYDDLAHETYGMKILPEWLWYMMYYNESARLSGIKPDAETFLLNAYSSLGTTRETINHWLMALGGPL